MTIEEIRPREQAMCTGSDGTKHVSEKFSLISLDHAEPEWPAGGRQGLNCQDCRTPMRCQTRHGQT